MTRRRSRSRRKYGARQLVKAGLLSLVGAGVAWLVVKTSTVYALVDLNPYAVSKVAPNDPRVAMNIATYEFLVHNGAVGERARRRAYQALAGEPLSEIPMLIAGVQALAAGDYRQGEALLVEARHREPRSLTTRLLLLNLYLRTNRIVEAGEEIAILNRLIPQASGYLVPELAKMAADPKTGSALMRVLARDPRLQQDVLTKLASTADPDLVLKAAKSVPAGAANNEWHKALLSRMVGNGDFTRGYKLWREFNGIAGEAGEKNVYDGRFQGLPGAAPFNWQLNASPAGVAERSSNGGLQVQYFGRDSADLASQILLLPSGRYKLVVQAEGDASGEGAQLVWSVGCAQAPAHLIDLPLRKISSKPQRVQAAFFIPPTGCSAQWLRLSGLPAEFPTEQDATVREVRIERIGA